MSTSWPAAVTYLRFPLCAVYVSKHHEIPRHSLLLVPPSPTEDPTRPIRFHHRSFPDFLTDPNRCKDSKFQIDTSKHHYETAKRCLELVNKGLKKNMCGLSRYSMNDELDPAVRDRYINETMKYCCRYWTSHLLADSERDAHLTVTKPILELFATTQQLLQSRVLLFCPTHR